ncbi:helix-turn-helix transcriptional regulator [Thalassotalea psychrophila]|uniref:Helix-turn-helix transcriptional regulator n=1 Tax=Thalassotalea psychrophila TaxID=3065647 RepID=A0ABY9TYQ6_9GAMM|nr:helix-turn-helix transcriptional regulator [Colwelliaceae bacterium SQ149]
MKRSLHLIDSTVAMPVIRYLQHINAPVIDLMEQAEIPLSLLENKAQKLPAYPWWKLMQLAYDQTQDRAFGFHIDEQQKLSILDPIMQQISHQSNSVYDALVNFIYMRNSVSSHGKFWLTKQSKGAWFIRGRSEFDPKYGVVPMEQVVFANMLRLLRVFTLKKWSPKLITLVQQDKHKIFKQYYPHAMISENNLYTGFYIPDSILGKLNPQLLGKQIVTQGEAILPETFAETLYQALLPYRRVKLPELKEVPEKIGLSLRQIQRRLAKEGTNYKEIIARIRFEFAKEWLLNFDYKITDIATALNYSSPGHFTRAFKQWSGITPKDYRNLPSVKKR